jgi:hypothetical protein
MLTASGVDGNVVNAVSQAVTAIGTAPSAPNVAPAMANAVQSIRQAMSSGTVTPDQAKGLVAVLVALRAAETSR